MTENYFGMMVQLSGNMMEELIAEQGSRNKALSMLLYETSMSLFQAEEGAEEAVIACMNKNTKQVEVLGKWFITNDGPEDTGFSTHGLEVPNGAPRQ